MRRTNIYLEDEQSQALEAASRTLGISRAELVRRLIDRGMNEVPASDVDVDVAAIEDSFGVLDGEVFDTDSSPIGRGVDDRARHLERVARQ